MSQINVNKIYDASAGGKAILYGGLSTQLGMRNKILNGDMDIAQRGTSFNFGIVNAYSLDRWFWQCTAATAATVSQQADAPADNEFNYSLRVAVTTADTAIAVGDVCVLNQRIEGYSARDLIGKTFTLSFRVRSSKTGIHCVAFKNSGLDRAYVAEYTVSSANTWETKTVTVPGGLVTAGTWNWTNGVGLIVGFALAAGTTYTTTANSWNSVDAWATPNQVNCLDTVGNIFAITGVQVEVGELATPYEHRSYGVELAMCQRYFEQVEFSGFFASGLASTQFNVPVTMKTSKRAIPTITLPSSTGKCYTTGGAALTPATTWTTVNPSTEAFSVVAAHTAAFGGVASLSIPCNSEI